MTPAQVKARLRQQGKTITQWAAENGYARDSVYRVLNGVDKAHYGRAHEIAIRLGLKEGEVCTDPSRALDRRVAA